MSNRRWNPIRFPLSQLPPGRLDEQIERAFDELLTMPWLAEPRGWMPQLDVFESADDFIIEADLPGVTFDELNVEVDGTSVTICGSRSERRTETTQGVIRVERRHGSFCRIVTLGQPVNGDGIQISQEHGVFRIRIPKQHGQERT